LMSKIKIKQINSDGQPAGAILTTDGEGNNQWVVPTLGDAEDGTYTGSRYEGGKAPAVSLEPTTKVSTAIDSINEVLGLLLPNAPAGLNTGVLALSASATHKAAQGYTSNSIAGGPSAGSDVARTTASSVNSTILQDLGTGDAGTVALWLNNAAVQGESFAFTDTIGDVKSTGVLRISDNKWGGTAQGGGAAPDGFFQTFDSQVVGATALTGLNTMQLKHSISGNTNNLTYIRDSLTALPVSSNVTVVQGTKVGTFSSGIEHYAGTSTLSVSANLTNLAGETYVAGTIISVTGPGSASNFAAGQGGLPSILNKDTLSFDLTSQTFTVSGNFQDIAAKVAVLGVNPNGTGASTQASSNLIVLSGTGGVREPSLTGGVAPSRVRMAGTGDTPSDITTATWSSTQLLNASGYEHEAVIAGGQIRNLRTNLSTGYLPVGPDYSTKDASQYVTYSFKVAGKSSISVTVTGTYAGVWVALPGVSTNVTKSPAALGGAWWNGFALYSGAGIPGRTNDTAAGCAAGTLPTGSGTQTYTLTFGTESSSNSTLNEVLVRFKLNAGQAITALTIS
jgi:hypothetical protein